MVGNVRGAACDEDVSVFERVWHFLFLSSQPGDQILVEREGLGCVADGMVRVCGCLDLNVGLWGVYRGT
jgi:hypothetical protein